MNEAASVVELTPAGKHMIRELRAARTRIFTFLLADFDDTDLERFGEYLNRLVQAFTEQAGYSAPLPSGRSDAP